MRVAKQQCGEGLAAKPTMADMNTDELLDFQVDANLLGLNAAVTSGGYVVAGPFAGYIIDRIGRRRSLMASFLLTMVGTAICASAPVGEYSIDLFPACKKPLRTYMYYRSGLRGGTIPARRCVFDIWYSCHALCRRACSSGQAANHDRICSRGFGFCDDTL